MKPTIETKDYNEEYSPAMQRVLLSALLSDTEAFARVRSIIDEKYFHDTLRPAVRLTLDYAEKYRTLPSLEQIEARTGIEVTKFSEDVAPHTDWVLDFTEGFCRYKAIEGAVLDGVNLLQRGEGAEIERRIKEAMTISLMSDLGTSYFEDPRARIDRLRDKSAYVSTGWKALDDKLYGGFTRGALNIFCGGSGSGKSLFLQNIALNWVFAGLNVVYITLELSEDLVSLRLDSMVSGRCTSDVFRQVDDVAPAVAMKGRSSGRLTIKKLPEGGTCANDLRAFLKEYQIKTGIKPDAIVVDYLDLMYPNNKRIDPSDQFIKDKFVAEELRALAHEFNVLCASASQLNRQSVEAMGEFDHSHIAGGISKINTADNVFAIFTTAAMKEKGVYVLTFLKTRSSGAVGQRIDLGYDPLSMRISDAHIAVENIHAASSVADNRAVAKEINRSPKQVPARPAPPAAPVDVAPSGPDVMGLIGKMRQMRRTEPH